MAPPPPQVIHLKLGAKLVAIKQYPMRKEAKEGLQAIIDKFLKYTLTAHEVTL